MKIEELSSYEILERRTIQDLNSESYLLKHKKSGARIALLSNDDENKVFYIGFRTPPDDSTGLPHILEHSTLCGSKSFPVKDPFVELVKGSLNTFLNAMTYPDKTVYPLASCNDKDFQNLMHVYLDAVFYPNIYKEDKIFKQEGWHYELTDKEGELKINGVVYNEMKGAFSSPDQVFARAQMEALYPDTAYGLESGGDPEVIPELTYEHFLDFHKRYYHPSNSYIYLYGNMDMAEKLDYIDKEYLSHFDYAPVDSHLKIQSEFGETRRVVKEYPIGEDESEKGNTFLSYNISVGDSLDKELYIAFQILDYALCSAPGAPLKKALTDAGIGTEIFSIYDNGLIQPFFGIVAKNADLEQEQEFLDIINKVLTGIVQNGFNKRALLAGLNHLEFQYREADFGSRPKGLMYGLQMLDSWLYENSDPFRHVECNETYAALRLKVESRYFEELVEQYLLEGGHKAILILTPKKGLTREREQALAKKLADYKAGLSDVQLEEIIEQTKALKVYQDTPDSEENLAKIPLLSRADMKKEAAKLIFEKRKIGDTDFIYHDLFTNGISYLHLLFKTDNVPAELFPYVGILRGVLGMLGTANYSYEDLFNEINIQTGGISANSGIYVPVDGDGCRVMLEMKADVMEDKLEVAVELLKEILFTTDFSDKKRLKEILAEGRSRLQEQMTGAAHKVAAYRAMSQVSKAAVAEDALSGIAFFRLVENLDTEFDKLGDQLVENLRKLAQIIFRPENLLIDLVGSKEAAKKLPALMADLMTKLYTQPVEKDNSVLVLTPKQGEGYKTPGQVQYVCRAGNFKQKGLSYHGSLKALRVMMGYDYLWNQVRVKGGAYGCMCSFGRNGDCYFVSYRDPNLQNTIEIYEKAADYIAGFEADERMLTQFIIGAVSELDTPLNASAKGKQALSAYLMGLTEEQMQKERDELLATSVEDLRHTAEYVRAFLASDCLCVVGNADKIQSAEGLFTKVENLIS